MYRYFLEKQTTTNTAWVRAWLLKLQQRVHSGTPASSTTKTGRHDIAEILLKVALSTINQNQIIIRVSSLILKIPPHLQKKN
jgi:hypothetical protein